MISDADFIIGLMRQGYNIEPNQLGFIPDTAIRNRYVPNGQYIMQYDLRGRRTGYILTGKISMGKNLGIQQAIIDYDRRGLGFGEMAFCSLLEKARAAACSSVSLKIAENLEAVTFFQAMGMEIIHIIHRENKRHRKIYQMYLSLVPQLFETITQRPTNGPISFKSVGG